MSLMALGAALGGAALKSAQDSGNNYLQSANSFSWNGKDMRRNIRYQKRMITWQNDQTKAMSLWSAHNMPAATMKGLKSAGLNPLLAAGGSTNIAPTVASSAATVPYSESYESSDGGDTLSPETIANLSSLFTEKKAAKTAAEANEAEQEARKEFFESDEGKKAVKDKLRMQYGAQNHFEQITQGAHTAKDAISTAGKAIEDNPQLFNWMFRDAGKTLSPSSGNTTHRDSNGHTVVSRRRNYSRRDNHSRIDNSRHYHFNFGSARGVHNYDTNSRSNTPVWYNPDLK